MLLAAQFGSTKTGLGTVGYRQVNITGGDAVARTTIGVFEIGGGAYGVNLAALNSATVLIEWDTGEGTPKYAHEDIKQTEIWQDRGLDTGNAKVIEENTAGEDYDHDAGQIHKDVVKSGSTTTITRT